MRFSPIALLVSLSIGLSVGHAQDDIDFDKARQLRQRLARGDQLTDEERTYLERAIRARRDQGQPPANQPARPRTGLVPLTDMSADDRYKGHDGGLYGEGQNNPPKSHQTAAINRAEQIQPLDAEGNPDKKGKIVLISVGMSNTTQEFSQFQRLANNDPEIASNVVIVDGAQGGMDARAWAQPDQINPPNLGRRVEPWTFLEQRLKQTGVTPQQVQVAWLKQARINPAGVGEFPRHTEELQAHIQTILHRLKERYPNLKIVYLSSRIYAGYARGPLNPEPYAYESAFAVRSLIQQQIKGEPSLNHDPTKGVVKAPLLLWGPYLWADGEAGRKVDKLVYRREDLAPDGTHPSRSGQQKVAELLLNFFKSDPTTKTWFVAD